MSKTIGYVDEEGIFSLLATFNPQNPDDMEAGLMLLHDEEMNAHVKSYSLDLIEIVFRPDDLSGYGF